MPIKKKPIRKPAVKRTRRRKPQQQGMGFFDNIKKAIQYTKEKLFFPANKLPGDSQAVYNKYADATVNGFTIRRAPIMSAVDKVLNWISLGQYNKKKNELAYDQVFHLQLVFHTNRGPLLVEKNERINIKDKDGTGESMPVAYDRADTVASVLEKARRKMGDHNFYQYNARSNNCQDFILNILDANGVLNESARKFIKQDAESLFKSLPGFMGKISQAATDLAGKISEITTGQSRRRAVNTSIRRGKKLGGSMKISPNIQLINSPVKNKKYRVIVDGKAIDFGDSRYEDYTQHKDPERKARYLQRHAHEDWTDIHKPGFWSRWLLWEEPSMSAAIKKLNASKLLG